MALSKILGDSSTLNQKVITLQKNSLDNVFSKEWKSVFVSLIGVELIRDDEYLKSTY